MARQITVELLADATKMAKSLNDAGKASGTFGDKVRDAGKKMTAFATVPIVGFLGAATKAAVEDAAAQAKLAKTLELTGNNHAGMAKAMENYLATAMKTSLFTDDELRPAFEDMVRTTGDAEKAMDMLDIAMDVAAGKGIDLETATKAVAKASEGQFAAVNKLVPGLLDLSDKTLTADQATAKLAALFSGQASAATETAAGKAQMMTRDLGELTEQIGTTLLPILGKLLDTIRPVIDKFAGMSSGMQTAIVVAGLAVAAIGPLIGAVTALSTAMAFLAANPIVLAIAALVAMAVATKVLYDRNEDFRKGVDATIDTLGRLWSALKKVGDIAGGVGGAIGGVIGRIPGFASGGVVGGAIGQAQLAVVHGGERITPYRGGNNGGSGGGMSLTVIVQGSVITDRDLGRVVADAMRDNALIGVG
jgi:phage-related protein